MRYPHPRHTLSPELLFLIEMAEVNFFTQEQIMIQMAAVLAALSTLKDDVGTLIAQGSAGQPVDLQPVLDAITDIDTQVKAATTAPVPPAVNTVAIGGTTALVIPVALTQPLTYASRDESIATVDVNGQVTGVAPGTVAVDVTDASGIALVIQVTVTGSPASTLAKVPNSR